jgi:hypothetical protein
MCSPDSVRRFSAGQWAGSVRVDYPNDPFSVNLTFKEIGTNFVPGLGFIPRLGIRKGTYNVDYFQRPGQWGIRHQHWELLRRTWTVARHRGFPTARLARQLAARQDRQRFAFRQADAPGEERHDIVSRELIRPLPLPGLDPGRSRGCRPA